MSRSLRSAARLSGVDLGPSAPSRMYYADAVRGILMSMGVLLHAAAVYGTRGDWLIADPATSVAFTWLRDAIHFFRMPLFFILSGFFLTYVMQRTASGPVFSRRMTRLVVPCVVVALALNIPTLFALAAFNGQPLSFSLRTLVTLFATGAWQMHLWFLVDLILFTLLIAAATQLAPVRRAGKAFVDALLSRRAFLGTGVFMLLLPLPHILAAGVGHFFPATYGTTAGILSISSILLYAPFFFVGMVLGSDRALLEAFVAFRRWQIGAVLMATGLLLLDLGGGPLSSAVDIYATFFLTWSLCGVLLQLSKRFLDRPSAPVRRFAEASYTIYLLHHTVVIAAAVALLRFDLPVAVKFTAVVVCGFMVPLLIHEYLVRRSRIAMFLLNGVTSKRKTRAPQAVERPALLPG